ncbi:IS3 family transposase [Hungatella sp.]|uniref:IS3 family transposase n=1 Tax=Hungatella sp. TaxID=2613924 RepID=UPI002A8419D1|nr:IS3 family transposase [Hungatella sp.]
MRYTNEQISAALLLLKATGSPKQVIDTLGYPSSPMLYHWRDMYPEYYNVPDQKHWKQAPDNLKQYIIKRCLIDGEPVKLVAEEIGYTPSLIYKWIREYRKKGHFSSMKKTTANVEVNPSNIESAEDINTLKAQMLDMQMEIDILKETINVLKKDPGIDQTVLMNREKAVIIDALKNKYSLPALCKKLDLAKSSYYYQEKAIHAEDKYHELRKKIVQLFHDNRDAFGYRKIHTLLHKLGMIISEKVVRRIMKQEALIVKQRRRQKYNSYKGEITPAVENVINRDFHADNPNQKWLTDITEFSIKAGKVYLSPIIDCFDGIPLTWTIGTSPNAELANTMLENAILSLAPGETPIVHSDRGCHYRWPEWIRLITEAG